MLKVSLFNLREEGVSEDSEAGSQAEQNTTHLDSL